ncbi:hypothetical protein V6N11_050306 [Hibiscus sabdariffa]|uniref:Reverse transcriptase zinc-binding domain-containing protein n=1 Tax=Hibiscus sabdariffa TaxID=183260 RepID=A0ABR2T9G8_9ROSI
MEEDGREAVSPRHLPGSDATFFGGVRFQDKGVVVVNCRYGAATVASMVDEYGQWQWELFEHKLPYSVLLRIASVKALARGRIPDRLCWGLTSNKQFTVCSTYEVRSPIHFGPDERVWSVIHRFKGSSRVRLFLWLLCHGRILTNDERVRRHLTIDGSCWFCGDVWEDIDHVFCRCPISYSIWLPLVRADRTEVFFALDFKHWLFLNLTNDGIFSTVVHHSETVFQRGLRMQQEAVVASVRGAAGAGHVVDKAVGGNSAADWMAKLASSDDLICHQFLSPPVGISVLLQQGAAD